MSRDWRLLPGWWFTSILHRGDRYSRPGALLCDVESVLVTTLMPPEVHLALEVSDKGVRAV
jgi:hypothetical protein